MIWFDEANEYRAPAPGSPRLLQLDGAALWTAPVGTPPPVADPPREGWSRVSGIDPAEILRVASIRVSHEQDVAAVRRATSCTPAEAADLRATALALVPDMQLTPWQLVALDRALGIATAQPRVRRALAVAVRAAHDMRSTAPARIGNHLGLPRPRETRRHQLGQRRIATAMGHRARRADRRRRYAQARADRQAAQR